MCRVLHRFFLMCWNKQRGRLTILYKHFANFPWIRLGSVSALIAYHYTPSWFVFFVFITLSRLMRCWRITQLYFAHGCHGGTTEVRNARTRNARKKMNKYIYNFKSIVIYDAETRRLDQFMLFELFAQTVILLFSLHFAFGSVQHLVQ